ncbi:MAG: acetylglutamate kinase, partial [Nitrospirae bacterium]|nr:acetylglutamate kinase [Fimbriimonadaceae bacterium]
VLSDRNDPSSLITRLSAAQARQLIANGKASDGMIPKLEAALEALDDGVGGVHLLNGKTANALLIEVFTDAGIGTMMTR